MHEGAKLRSDCAAVCCRAGLLALVGIAVLGLLASNGTRDPLLVWNASPSSPQGLYIVVPGRPRTGDFVIAWPPAEVAALAQGRGYLPPGVPLVKSLAAGSGDVVCAHRARVWANGNLVAERRTADSAGRRLPRWSGCHALAADEMLLLGSGGPASFDGRYFGPLNAARVIGRARLMWPA